MNMNKEIPLRNIHDKEARLSGVGANALWDGPLDLAGLPKGLGYSGGKNGIKLRLDKPSCSPEPITQRAKARR